MSFADVTASKLLVNAKSEKIVYCTSVSAGHETSTRCFASKTWSSVHKLSAHSCDMLMQYGHPVVQQVEPNLTSGPKLAPFQEAKGTNLSPENAIPG